jgi:hypothetical protein
MPTVQPYFSSTPNANPASAFSHFEVQACREYSILGDPTGVNEFVTVIHSPVPADPAEDEGAVGPVFYTVYGRLKTGGVEAIADRVSAEAAEGLIARLNGPPADVDWQDTVEAFASDYLGYLNNDDWALPDVDPLLDLLGPEARARLRAEHDTDDEEE